ncbi:MAG: hypothetical protein DMG15_14650 [Acidobacteria bacterium]|nr:MAG: hypothetical protein DMG15_14650 [Acidobacteriota bacterium]
MYKCQICGNISEPRSPAFRLTLKTRDVYYKKREKVNGCYKRLPSGGTKFVRTDDPGGVGRECVHEAIVCHACFVKLKTPP